MPQMCRYLAEDFLKISKKYVDVLWSLADPTVAVAYFSKNYPLLQKSVYMEVDHLSIVIFTAPPRGADDIYPQEYKVM